jgi:hypothetical protein
MEEEIKHFEKGLRRYRILYRIFLHTTFSLLAIGMGLLSNQHQAASLLLLLCAISGLGMGYVGRKCRDTTAALAETEDVRVIGALLDALYTPGFSQARQALTMLLPRLHQNAAVALTPSQHQHLHRFLSRFLRGAVSKPENIALGSAMLMALDPIGHTQDRTLIEQLAARNSPLQMQAQQCVLHGVERRPEDH